MKPRIAAEYLIGTFTGQYNLVRVAYLLAEIKERGINVCLARQVVRFYGTQKIIRLCLVGTFQISMLTV